MKRVIFFITLFATLLLYGQGLDSSKIKLVENLKIIKIDSIGKHYLISAIDINNNKYLLWDVKPKRRVLRKYCKNQSIKKIEIGKEYTFNLSSATYGLGYYQTGELFIGKQLIWKKGKSDFEVYRSTNIKGLFYLE